MAFFRGIFAALFSRSLVSSDFAVEAVEDTPETSRFLAALHPTLTAVELAVEDTRKRSMLLVVGQQGQGSWSA